MEWGERAETSKGLELMTAAQVSSGCFEEIGASYGFTAAGGRDGQGRHFRGRVSHLGADWRQKMRQQRRTEGTGSNSQVVADNIISWVCGLTGLI